MLDALYLHDAHENVASSARLRDALMDEAREIAALRRQVAGSPAPSMGLDWVEPAHVSGVHLYREGDTWFADLTLDGVAPARPRCIGSPRPMATEGAARIFALSLLSDIVLSHAGRSRMPQAQWPLPSRPHAFVYDGLVVNLPKETVEALVSCGADRIGEAYAERRLAEIRTDLLEGAKLTPGRLMFLDVTARRAFHTVCGLAALKGLERWG